MSEVIIDVVRKEEFDDVLTMWKKEQRALGIPFKDYIHEQIDSEQFFCIRDELGHIAAVCTYDIKKRFPEVEICALITLENHRGKGYAKKLIQHIANIPEIRRLVVDEDYDFTAEAVEGIPNNTFYDKISTRYVEKEAKTMNLRMYYLDKRTFFGEGAGVIKVKEDMYGKTKYIDYMLYLFEQFGKDELPEKLSLPNDAWNDYIEIIYKRKNRELPEIEYDKNLLDDITIEKSSDNEKKIALAFSGGKDSVAAAAFLKDFEYDARLFSVKGINRGFFMEYKAAERVANSLNVPLEWGRMSFSGSNSDKENVVKNHLILSLMMEYMINNNIYKAACGTYIEDNMEKTSTVWGLSDMYELYRAFEKAIQRTFPQFKFCCWFQGESQGVAYLVYHHPELIPMYQSCIMPDRYRQAFRNQLKKKYPGIELMENRCGRCWKCVQEALLLNMYGYNKIDDRYLREEVVRVFQKDEDRVKSESVEKAKTVRELISRFITVEDTARYKMNPDLVVKDVDFSLI